MYMNELNKNAIYLVLAMLLFATSTFAQLICKIDKREKFYDVLDENSGLAYHPKENILIIALDKPLFAGFGEDGSEIFTYIKGYDIIESEAFIIEFNFDSFLNTDKSNTNFEGITHLKENYFVLLEENENKIYFLEYKPAIPQFVVLSVHSTGIPLIDDGIQGISYNPHINRLYLVREDNQLFSIEIDQLPGPYSAGTIDKFESGEISRYVSGIETAGGLFHLGKIYPANHPLSNNILVVGRTNPRAMVEIAIPLDKNNNLSLEPIKIKSKVIFSEVAPTVPTEEYGIEPKPQGIAVIGNTIYISNDKELTYRKDGGLSKYLIKSVNSSCEPGYYSEDCECVACPAELWINTNAYNDNYSLTDLYESSRSIETVETNSSIADVIIRNNETVDLKSDHITLNAGFKVEAGACLNAEIKACQ